VGFRDKEDTKNSLSLQKGSDSEEARYINKSD